jgi:hypothetical protein
MASGPTSTLDVRLLGLDQHANPRTAIPGTITDGRNYTMDKVGRIQKRPGQTALAMLDTSSAAVVGRELSSLGDEMVLSDGKKIYSRDPIGGAWIPRGRTAYERLDITSAHATNATCNGRDSFLFMDSAKIGRYQLICMSGGASYGDTSESEWMVVDSTTGEVLVAPQSVAFWDWHVGTSGEATETFVAFAASSAGTIAAFVWDAGYRTVQSATVVADLMDAPDDNTYTLKGSGSTTYPFAALRVAANTWLIAYQQTGAKVAVRKVTRTSGVSFTVSAAVQVTTSTNAISLAWAYTAGSSTAHLALTNGSTLLITYRTVSVADLALGSYTAFSPDAWNSGTPVQNSMCRGATGIMVGATPYFFFDTRPVTGGRHVYVWSPGAADATKVFADSGLFTRAFTPTLGETGEIGLGICNQSDWQPSAFIMRVWCAAGVVSAWAIGAHVHNGDFAGRPMTAHLPNVDDAAFPIGVYTNPISLGGSGTVTVKIASLTFGTLEVPTTCSQPAEIANTLLLPGACLKAYDGEHVAEAAFTLGPESVAAVEGTRGQVFTITTGSKLTTDDPTNSENTIITHFNGTGDASVTLEVETAYGATPWPAGTVYFDFWAKVVGPTPGQDYFLYKGAAPEDYIIKTSASMLAWQNESKTHVTLPATWTHFQFAITVGALAGATTADKLQIVIRAEGANDDTAVFYLAWGGAMAPTFTVPYPVMETGLRQYCACAVWSDSRGRLQRSQVSPAVSLTNASGLANTVTVEMVNVTERDPAVNLDASTAPVELEIYRTVAAGTTFYRAGKVTNSANAADATFTDDVPDTDLTANERLYTTGDVLECWPPIGCNIVASHQGRVFVATSDNQVFYTLFADTGEGLRFAAELIADTQHINGALTALLSLDDKLAICTATSVASLAGIGPESTGTPAYDTPMLINAGHGVLSQRASARIPAGWVVVTRRGAFLLDRGLSMQELGDQVEDSLPSASTWYAAVFVPTKHQVRLSSSASDPNIMVWDNSLPGPPERIAQWFAWTVPSNIMAFAPIGSTLYQLAKNGTVYTADSGYGDAGTAYQEWFQFAVISPSGPNGWSRISALRLLASIATGTTLKVIFDSTSEVQEAYWADTTTIAGGATVQDVIAKPKYGKVSAMTISVSENASTTTSGFTVDAIGLQVANKGGLGKLPAAKRMTRSA